MLVPNATVKPASLACFVCDLLIAGSLLWHGGLLRVVVDGLNSSAPH